MDLWIILSLVMLAIWAFVTFTTTAPGWIHILLTVGMFLLIYRIVVRGTRGVDRGDGAAELARRMRSGGSPGRDRHREENGEVHRDQHRGDGAIDLGRARGGSPPYHLHVAERCRQPLQIPVSPQ